MKILFSIFCFSLLIACQENLDTKEPPGDWFFNQRAYPYQDIDSKAYVKASNYVKELKQRKSGNTLFEEPWVSIGPNNVGGRITDIEMWSDDESTILAASAFGGIFKSTNLGMTWIPIFDDAASLAVGDIDISKSNSDVIYVGTGEANTGGGSLAYDGVGVYKSIDRGESWEQVGLEGIGSIGKVAIDPLNENKVFVAGMGRLFGNNPDRGIFRSEDGGTSWEQVLSVSDSTGGIDLAIHPTNSDTIFAAMWERKRRPNNIIYGGPTSGLYRSYDGGDNWTLIENGLSNSGEEKGRMAISIAPSDPSKMYVYVTKKNGTTEGVYLSENYGDSWESLPIDGITDVPYQWWFSKLFVNPNDAGDIYLASFEMHNLRVNSDEWSTIFQGVHVDHHALYVHPLNDQLLINGNDGGVYLSLNGGESYSKAEELPNIQFYACEIDPNNTDIVYGGAQDNGTWKNVSDDPNGWYNLFGGDGFRVTVEPGNSDIVYYGFQNGNIYRSNDGGDTQTFIMNSISNQDRKNWNTPLAIDYNNPSIIYVGTERVWKSTNRGNAWEAISEDLSDGPYDGNRTFGTIVTMEVSRANSEIIYVGTDDGNVWMTPNGGTTWNQINPPMEYNRWVTSVLPDPKDENVAYVTLSGFRYDTDDGHVYKTIDQGLTWEDITNGLPDIPINDIQIGLNNTNRLYLATDVGVFYRLGESEDWEILGEGLPQVPIIDIDIEKDGKLVAATYGRSMYYYITPEITSINNLPSYSIDIFPNPATEYISLQSEQVDLINSSIQITNMTGKVMMLSKFEEKLSVEYLPKGIYSVNLLKSGKLISTETFVKH